MKILIFGAGSTGRGHLAALLYEHGYRDITFVDKNEKLVDYLQDKRSYTVHLLGDHERELVVKDFCMLSRKDETRIIDSFLDADLVLTSVIADNLEDVAEVIAKAIIEMNTRGVAKSLNVIACENFDNASSYLKKFVCNRLQKKDREYLDQHVGFPDAIISRVVPLATENPGYITAEDYNEWSVRKEQFAGSDPGIPFIDITDSFEAKLERKFWIHNGGHATVAYAGYLKGYRYIHEAVNDTQIAAFAGKVMDEIGEAIIHKYGFAKDEIARYKNSLVTRGLISEMKDEILRVIRNPIRKLGLTDRLLAPAIYASQNNLPNDYIIKAAVNITLYDNKADAESVRMQEIIQNMGFEYFAADFLGAAKYPAICGKLIKYRMEDGKWIQ